MILVTGASGYIGRRLLSELRRRGRPLRPLVRRLEALPESERAGAAVGDVSDRAALRVALSGVSVAYYLVHGMAAGPGFCERDRAAAEAFAAEARAAGVGRIIYLGALAHGPALSDHLASRQEVGGLLRASGVPVIEFRASVIIGEGSISFDLAATLVEKLPVMVTPRWVRTLAQPIAVDDVIAYLIEALDADVPGGGIIEIGGADRVSYGGLMREIARRRGLTRVMIPVPALSPHLSALWLSLVAPRHAAVGPHLIEGVRNESVVRDPAALSTFRVRPIGIEEAVRRAMPEEAARVPRPVTAVSSAFAFLVCIAMAAAAAGAGMAATREGLRSWYGSIVKPSWTPPDAVFGPVWTTLYLVMSVAAWRVWRRDGLREARLPFALHSFQLLFNAAWSWIFFGFRMPTAAFVGILALWLLIAANAVYFSARDRLAALLLLPYLAWVSFAAVLNGAIAWMNR